MLFKPLKYLRTSTNDYYNAKMYICKNIFIEEKKRRLVFTKAGIVFLF
jgi:hypothetical protein